MARVTVDALAKRIVPVVSNRTCVVYGDWSRRNGIRGHASSPVKGLKQALQKRAMVVSMDEFRTSKLCSQCHQELSSVRYAVDTMLPKRRKCKGVVLPRNRAQIQYDMKKCYGVLRCEHEECSANFWDRDVNAAINMVNLLKSEVLGLGRIDEFKSVLEDAPSSVLYKSLHTNLPTSIMQLKDFPFQAGVPSYPSHADVLEYLQNYAKHFGVDEFVRTNTKVTTVSKVGDQWKISVESKDKGAYEEEFDRLVVANGHFNKAWQAPITGIENFPGVVSHARSYRASGPYQNKRVLVIGRGPSGQDISLELAAAGVKEVFVAALDYDPSADDKKDKCILKSTVDYIAEDGTVMFTVDSSSG